ncbi:hypothetical protein B0H14DRAFT_3769112 [Mycena olivaceomarginata]|nr:hypothetical protein B0H14DRAFT_3769112 [Mycena olivaceomarginata]
MRLHSSSLSITTSSPEGLAMPFVTFGSDSECVPSVASLGRFFRIHPSPNVYGQVVNIPIDDPSSAGGHLDPAMTVMMILHLTNNAARDAKLLFTQARRTSDDDEEDSQSKFHRMQKDLDTERCTVAKQTAIIVNFIEKLQFAGQELQMETQMHRAAEVHAKEAVKELEEYKQTFRAALKAFEALAA